MFKFIWDIYYLYIYCSWWTNPEALTVIDVSKKEIEAGDFVVISPRKDWVIEKQKGHGGWNPLMEKVHYATIIRLKRQKISHILFSWSYISYRTYRVILESKRLHLF